MPVGTKQAMNEVIDIIDYMRSLPDEMKTEAVCWHALRQNWYSLRHIPHNLQTKEMQIYALKHSPDALLCIKGELWDELVEIINDGE